MPRSKSQNGGMDKQLPSQDVGDQSGTVSKSRRQFTKTGLAVSGVMLTLASRPVLGQVSTCQTPSGFASGNVSTHGTPVTCGGRTPGYWGTHSTEWPSPYLPGTCSSSTNGRNCTSATSWSGGTKFNSVFNCSGYGSAFNPYTMMQVIWLNGTEDPQQLGAHIVAALLNARMGWTPVLTEAQVIGIFNEWNLNGYYEPTAGVKWYAADIVNYLLTTMPL